MNRFIYIVRQDVSGPEGPPIWSDVGVFETQEGAYECNGRIPGPRGLPNAFGGEIWEVEANIYPLTQNRIFGYRQNWLGDYDYGWLDLRDKPAEDNPDWVEFQRLRKVFEPPVDGLSLANPVGEVVMEND